MKTFIYIAFIAAIVGIQVPALAGWTLTPCVSNKIEQPSPSWTASVRPQSNPVVSNIIVPVVKTQVVSIPVVNKPIEPQNSWLIQSQPAYVSSYVKSEDEVKVFTPQNLPKNAMTASVPEPASLFGLSAGLMGILFQAKRMRKR